jgi:hypothetical protein
MSEYNFPFETTSQVMSVEYKLDFALSIVCSICKLATNSTCLDTDPSRLEVEGIEFDSWLTTCFTGLSFSDWNHPVCVVHIFENLPGERGGYECEMRIMDCIDLNLLVQEDYEEYLAEEQLYIANPVFSLVRLNEIATCLIKSGVPVYDFVEYFVQVITSLFIINSLGSRSFPVPITIVVKAYSAWLLGYCGCNGLVTEEDQRDAVLSKLGYILDEFQS